ncbi:MAG: putative bifunctional diguanylate cyclase/phosphodiesterase [Bacilli bacterium]
MKTSFFKARTEEQGIAQLKTYNQLGQSSIVILSASIQHIEIAQKMQSYLSTYCPNVHVFSMIDEKGVYYDQVSVIVYESIDDVMELVTICEVQLPPAEEQRRILLLTTPENIIDQSLAEFPYQLHFSNRFTYIYNGMTIPKDVSIGFRFHTSVEFSVRGIELLASLGRTYDFSRVKDNGETLKKNYFSQSDVPVEFFAPYTSIEKDKSTSPARIRMMGYWNEQSITEFLNEEAKKLQEKIEGFKLYTLLVEKIDAFVEKSALFPCENAFFLPLVEIQTIDERNSIDFNLMNEFTLGNVRKKHTPLHHMQTREQSSHELLLHSLHRIDRLTEENQKAEKKFDLLAHYANELVMTIYPDKQGLFNVNAACEQFFKRTKKELTAVRFDQLLANSEVDIWQDTLFLLKQGIRRKVTLSLLDELERGKLYELYCLPFSTNNHVSEILIVAQPLTLGANDLAERYIYTDSETGLPNRTRLKEHLNEWCEGERPFAVLFINVNNFRTINDRFGHTAGDEVLKRIARRIRAVVSSSHGVFRFSGDKFCVVLYDVGEEEGIRNTAQSILSEMSRPIRLRQREVFVSGRVGVSFYPTHGQDYEKLLKSAEVAMNESYESHERVVNIYEHSMDEKAKGRYEIETQLRKAIRHNELTLHYQPIVSIKSGEIAMSEALLRWSHPTLGLVSPAEFIPVAERSGQIYDLGNWVLQQALTDTRILNEMGYRGRGVAVNVSAKQLEHPSFFNDVSYALQHSGISPQQIHIEITETASLNNFEATRDLLDALGQLGMRIAVDDFGTGYSALSYLYRLPIHFLKIDRSFIQTLESEAAEHKIVEAIISMCGSLNLKVVAEGIETKRQLELLSSMNCHYGQGYYMYRPQTFAKLQEILSNEYSKKV